MAGVEGGVHVACRARRRAVREEDDDPEVLRQVERLELASVTRAELRAVREEEGNVGAEARCDPVQLLVRDRLG